MQAGPPGLRGDSMCEGIWKKLEGVSEGVWLYGCGRRFFGEGRRQWDLLVWFYVMLGQQKS